MFYMVLLSQAADVVILSPLVALKGPFWAGLFGCRCLCLPKAAGGVAAAGGAKSYGEVPEREEEECATWSGHGVKTILLEG